MLLRSIDFTKDIRYQQGVDTGMQPAKEENATNLIKEGFDPAFIERTIGSPMKKLQELTAQVAAVKVKNTSQVN